MSCVEYSIEFDIENGVKNNSAQTVGAVFSLKGRSTDASFKHATLMSVGILRSAPLEGLTLGPPKMLTANVLPRGENF